MELGSLLPGGQIKEMMEGEGPWPKNSSSSRHGRELARGNWNNPIPWEKASRLQMQYAGQKLSTGPRRIEAGPVPFKQKW